MPDPTLTDKQVAVKALEHMSEAATFAEILEDLAVLAAIRLGEADLAAGRIRTHAEFLKRSAEWVRGGPPAAR